MVSSDVKTKAQTYIDENPVMVFSKSYCPYCNAAKALLRESGANFKAIELDQMGSMFYSILSPILFPFLVIYLSSICCAGSR